MSQQQVNLFKVFMAPNVLENIKQVFDSGNITQGPMVEKYEQALATYIGNENIVTVNSATSGLTLALRLLDLPMNTKVLCTPLTCTATNWPVLANNLDIKWVDVDVKTCNMDLKDLRTKLDETTRVVLFVHWGGYPINLHEIEDIKTEYKNLYGKELYVIEDCAHAFGATYKYKKIGNSNNICVFSTQAIKHLTTIDGGFITFPSEEMTKRAKKLRWFGIDRNQRTTPGGDFRLEPDVEEWGYKFHMNDVNAAVGLANLEYVDKNLTQIKTVANYYNQELKNVQGVELLETAYGASPSYWIYTIKIVDKYNFMKFMKERGIICSQVHNRNDGHTCVKMFKTELPQLDILEKSIVCIPCGWWIDMPTAYTIVSCIKEWCKKKAPIIREIENKDWNSDFLKVLCQLNHQVYNNYTLETFQEKLKIFKQLGQYVYIAEIQDEQGNNKIIGTIKLIIEPKFYDSVGHIEDVVVDKNYKGMQIGKKLVKYATLIAFEKYNCYKVVLNVSEGIKKFYEKCDYELDEYNTSYTYRMQKMKQNF